MKSQQNLGEVVYIFDDAASVDFQLMYSEFYRYQEAIHTAIKNDSVFKFSSDYLNNIGKINCAGAWFNLSDASKLLNEDEPKSMAAMVLLTRAETLITCAIQYYMTVIEPRRKGGITKNEENNSYKDEAIKYYILENKKNKLSKRAATEYIFNNIAPMEKSTIEKKWLSPKSIEDYKKRNNKNTPC